MPSLWKPQNGSHRDLEISHQNARFPHSHKPIIIVDEGRRRRTEPEQSVTHVSGLICYRCFRLRRSSGFGSGIRDQGLGIGIRDRDLGFMIRDKGLAIAVLRRELRTVVVGRIAIDGVDVIDAALRRVLDDERRALHPEIRHAAVRRRPAPGEVGLRAGCARISAIRGSANASFMMPAHSRTISSSIVCCAADSAEARMPSG